jgi:histidinol phosphatase-like PHP family hydrolase
MSHATYADYHVHTHLSPCGKPAATAAAMIARAQEKGLAAIGFADHVTPQPVPGCSFYDGQRPRVLAELRAEIAASGALDRAPDLRVRVGMEADYSLAGPACLNDSLHSLADHVVVAASHFHLSGAPKPAEDTPRAKAELMLQVAAGALAVPGVDIWAHPFECSRLRPLGPILETVTDDELAALIALANERAVLVEINGGAALQEAYCRVMPRFYGLAREMGARFSITSDAHHPDELDRLDLALRWAQEMGVRDRELVAVGELGG